MPEAPCHLLERLSQCILHFQVRVPSTYYHRKPRALTWRASSKTVHMRNNILYYKKAILAHYACTNARRLTLPTLGDHWVNVRATKAGRGHSSRVLSKYYKMLNRFIRIQCASLFFLANLWVCFETLLKRQVETAKRGHCMSPTKRLTNAPQQFSATQWANESSAKRPVFCLSVVTLRCFYEGAFTQSFHHSSFRHFLTSPFFLQLLF